MKGVMDWILRYWVLGYGVKCCDFLSFWFVYLYNEEIGLDDFI